VLEHVLGIDEPERIFAKGKSFFQENDQIDPGMDIGIDPTRKPVSAASHMKFIPLGI
jgi:hypothetical protein